MRSTNSTLRSVCSGMLLASCVLLASSGVAVADERSKKIPLAEAPAAVRETVVRVIGDGQFDELKRKFMLGKFVYEAEYLRDNQEHSVTVSEAGEILQESVEIPRADTPAPVIETATKTYPNGKISEVERVTADGKTFYEVSIDLPDNKEREVLIDPEGNLLDDREDD